MNHKHYNSIILNNDIVPKSNKEEELCLKLIKQKEKFILEDAVHALRYNKNIKKTDNLYSLTQYINEINNITNQYYLLYIQISQFEAYLRTYINHKMVSKYGNKWHRLDKMNDLKEFNTPKIKQLEKPSQALNSISFGTLELVFLNGGRYGDVFQSYLLVNTILTKDKKPKYRNKNLIKNLFSIVRNARNDICHHRRIGESIKTNSKYHKKNMTKSDLLRALNDLKILLGYDSIFDVKQIDLKYNKF